MWLLLTKNLLQLEKDYSTRPMEAASTLLRLKPVANNVLDLTYHIAVITHTGCVIKHVGREMTAETTVRYCLGKISSQKRMQKERVKNICKLVQFLSLTG